MVAGTVCKSPRFSTGSQRAFIKAIVSLGVTVYLKIQRLTDGQTAGSCPLNSVVEASTSCLQKTSEPHTGMAQGSSGSLRMLTSAPQAPIPEAGAAEGSDLWFVFVVPFLRHINTERQHLKKALPLVRHTKLLEHPSGFPAYHVFLLSQLTRNKSALTKKKTAYIDVKYAEDGDRSWKSA